MKPRWLKICLGAAAALAVGAGAVLLVLHHFGLVGHGTPPGAAMPEPPVRVYVVRPQQGGVERTVTRPASVHAFQHAALFAKVSGYLRDQVVDIGDRVKPGEVMAQIEVPEVVANVGKARADLQKAEALVSMARARQEEADARLREARAKVEQSQADLASARSLLRLRQVEYKRFKSLAESKDIREEVVEEKLQARSAAESAERAAAAAVATATAGVAAAEAGVKSATATVEDAKAQVRVARAVLDRARTFEEYTRIRSPYDGVVTQRNYHEGDFIRDASTGAAGKPVLAVARTDKMRVVVWVPDPDVTYTRRGAPATLRIDSLPDHPFKGVVARTAVSENYDTRTMRAEVDLPNPDGLLTDGMFGAITLFLGKSRHGLTIPSACLGPAEKNNERPAYVVQGGKAHRVTVRVGLDDGIHAEALSGLRPDDQVIEQHGPGLAEGVPVEVVERPPPGAEGGELANQRGP